MKEKLFSLSKKDFIIQAFKASGPGGQHRNKCSTAIRITHKASGAVGESSNSRSQYTNKKLAFKRLTKSGKFKVWLNRTILELIEGETIEEKVEKMMKEKIKVEVKDGKGRWVEEENAPEI